MSTVAQAKAAIYNRLASAPTFHPASADLFSDFTLQSGDVITVTSDNTSYNVPIYGMQMKWNGNSKVSVQSTGNEKRDSLERMIQSASSGGGGGGGYRQERKRQERIEFIVGIDENGEFYVDNPGYIVLAINESDESVVHINADHILIGSDSGIDPNYQGKDLDGTMTQITTDFTVVKQLLATKIDAGYIEAGFTTSGDIVCTGIIEGELHGGVSAPQGTEVEAPTIRSLGDVYVRETVKLNVADITKNTAGDTLTIKYVNGDTITFSKATSITSSSFAINQTGSIAGRSHVGSLSASSLSGSTYIFFTMTAGGFSQKFYITVNS